MSNRDDPGDGPVFTASKDGVTLRFSRDPHPGTEGYLVVEGLGLLVLFPNNRGDSELPSVLHQIEVPDRSDHDAQLRDAFQALGSRVPVHLVMLFETAKRAGRRVQRA
jgi:hypothetical protein